MGNEEGWDVILPNNHHQGAPKSHYLWDLIKPVIFPRYLDSSNSDSSTTAIKSVWEFFHHGNYNWRLLIG